MLLEAYSAGRCEDACTEENLDLSWDNLLLE